MALEDILRGLTGVGMNTMGYLEAGDYSDELEEMKDSPLLDPFGQANRERFQGMARDMYSPNYDVSKTPGMAAAMKQANQAISRRGARMGQTYSGNVMHDLNAGLSGMMLGQFNQQSNQVLNAAGAGMRPDSGSYVNAAMSAAQANRDRSGALGEGLNSVWDMIFPGSQAGAPGQGGTPGVQGQPGQTGQPGGSPMSGQTGGGLASILSGIGGVFSGGGADGQGNFGKIGDFFGSLMGGGDNGLSPGVGPNSNAAMTDGGGFFGDLMSGGLFGKGGFSGANIGGGLIGGGIGALTGMMQGKDVGSSLLQGGLSGLGTAFGGPIGGMVGGFAGNLLGDVLGMNKQPASLANAAMAGYQDLIESGQVSRSDAKSQLNSQILRLGGGDWEAGFAKSLAREQGLNPDVDPQVLRAVLNDGKAQGSANQYTGFKGAPKDVQRLMSQNNMSYGEAYNAYNSGTRSNVWKSQQNAKKSRSSSSSKKTSSTKTVTPQQQQVQQVQQPKAQVQQKSQPYQGAAGSKQAGYQAPKNQQTNSRRNKLRAYMAAGGKF